MIQTVGDLIDFSLRVSGIIGVGQTAMAEDSYTGLDWLRMIISEWQKKRWLVYVQQEVSVAASTGAQSYTIGPGQDFDCARPAHIAAAYIRIIPGAPPNLVDIPVTVLGSREEYASISVKTLETIPAYVFYDSGWPSGRLYWWPVPPANMYGLYVTVMSPLPTYTALTDQLNVPPEYYPAMIWSLAIRMQLSYGLPANPAHVAAMREALNTLRQANTQVPELTIPAPIGRIRSDLSLVGKGLGRAFILDQGAVL